MIVAKKVIPYSGRYLNITFSNNEIKIFDCIKLFELELYKDLNNENLFNSVFVDECGIICWSDIVDLDPFMVYEESLTVNI